MPAWPAGPPDPSIRRRLGAWRARARVGYPRDRSARHPTYRATVACPRSRHRAPLVGATAASADDVSSWEEIDLRAPRGARARRSPGDSSVNDRILGSSNSITSDDVEAWTTSTRRGGDVLKFAVRLDRQPPHLRRHLRIGPDKTYEALDDIYQETSTRAPPSSMSASVRASTSSTPSTISSAACRPCFRRSSLIATAAVAEAGLLQVKEEYDLVESILRDDVNGPRGVSDETRPGVREDQGHPRVDR